MHDLSLARAILEAYPPHCAEQERVRRRMLAFLDEHPLDACSRSCIPGHFTAATLLVDRSRGQACLTHHRKLDRWLQFGGHCDGDANFAHVAWRETLEESGIEPLHLSALPIDLDIHAIPARASEPEHLHLDVRYLAEAPPGAREQPSEESHSLGWFTPEQALALDLDESVRRLFRLAFAR